MLKHIVVVEDDFLQEGPLDEHLQEAFPKAKVTTLCTESEFRGRLDDLRQDAPDVVIMDVMLRWAHPGPAAPVPPPDVAAEGYFRAGLRCASLMASDDRLRDVPVIIYTILERSDLDRGGSLADGFTYVRKSPDLDILTRRIRQLTR